MKSKDKTQSSKVFGVDRWRELRIKLNDNYNASKDWNEAINIFSRRLSRYYINPIIKIKRWDKWGRFCYCNRTMCFDRNICCF